MKKTFYFIVSCLLSAFVMQLQAVNVVPTAGTFYNIVQTPSNMVIGAVSLQPVVQNLTNSLDQAFEFIPVDGKPDTYYIRNYFGKYLNKSSGSNWNVIYETSTNLLLSEWVITDDASSTSVFRLMLNANSKYLATDAVTTNSNLYCDKAANHVRGLFMLTTATIPTDLVEAFNSLTLGDISAVTSNLTLPSTAGTANISVTWATSTPANIATDGTVTRPEKYDATVFLTATLTQVMNDITFSMTKQFIATVKAKNIGYDQLAKWNFGTNSIYIKNDSIRVLDAAESGFEGTLVNDARIRTIGGNVNGKVNVLDLGNGTGFFDMGTEIGKDIYLLSNYSICAFFRIDDSNTDLNSNGNFIWNFSNSANAPVDMNGYIIGSLKNQSNNITPGYYAVNDQSVGLNTNAPKGGWHHIAFTQNGIIGTIYIDGVQVAQNSAMTNLPSVVLPKTGLTGTLNNWLGRSCYPADVYLKKTLIYDFQLLSVPLTADDLVNYISVSDSIVKLNAEYMENSDVILPELASEQSALDLGNISAVVSNITLPVKGATDNSVSISWKSTDPTVIASDGTVNRPYYFDKTVTLTATLSKNGQKLTKAFNANVLVDPGTTFTSDLLIKYDFSAVSADSVVTDAAEKHFTGVAKNDATITSIGITTKYNVLNLGDSIGYFDMGTEVGKVLYGLSDYTMSCYYRIDESYQNLAANGNFIWSFSNSTNANTDRNGYIIGSLKDQSVSITPGYYTAATGNQALAFASPALQGGWHNLAYTQKDTIGTLYIDGMPFVSGSIKNLPKTALPKAGFSGTLNNWLGRSCYTTDSYLRKTLIYDFRMYKTALNDTQIQTSELNVGSTISALDAAYNESYNGVESIQNSPYKIIPTNAGIKILGLYGNEIVSVFDIAGRQLKVSNVNRITINAGVYIVKIDNFVSKVIVK